MKINHNNFIAKIFESGKDGYSLDDIKIAHDEIFNFISETLVQNNRVEIRGFGSFSLRNRLVPEDPRKNNSKNTIRVNRKSIYFRQAKLNNKSKIK